jgi:hypothetical protein
MIKLTNILAEMRLNNPIPRFKTNDQHEKYLEKNYQYKKDLVDAILKKMDKDNDPEWDYVKQGWYDAKLVRFTQYNIGDEVMIDSGSDDRAYISIHPMKIKYLWNHQFTVKLGSNTFYVRYY